MDGTSGNVKNGTTANYWEQIIVFLGEGNIVLQLATSLLAIE